MYSQAGIRIAVQWLCSAPMMTPEVTLAFARAAISLCWSRYRVPMGRHERIPTVSLHNTTSQALVEFFFYGGTRWSTASVRIFGPPPPPHAAGWKAYPGTQCYASAAEVQAHYAEPPQDGNRADNPLFNGGGDWGVVSLSECQRMCLDTLGCVAVEWHASSPDGTARCAGAWACSDLSHAWPAGAVYRREGVAGVCPVECRRGVARAVRCRARWPARQHRRGGGGAGLLGNTAGGGGGGTPPTHPPLDLHPHPLKRLGQILFQAFGQSKARGGKDG